MYDLKAWSYSSLNLFKQCPHRYERERLKKDIPRAPDTEAIIYGTELHKAAEDYIGKGTPIPKPYIIVEPWLEVFQAIAGDKYVELKMGITRKNGVFEACDYNDPNVWFRGIADLVIVNEITKVAYVIDYKTGKSAKYADPLQLELMAACVFLLYPETKSISALLLYVVCQEVIKRQYTYAERFKVFEKLDDILHRRTMAYVTGVFNRNPNGLCRNYCPVLDCPHNGRGT